MRYGYWQPYRRRVTVGVILLLSLIVGFLCIGFAQHVPSYTVGNVRLAHHTGHTATLTNCCAVATGDHMKLWKSTFLGISPSFSDLLTLMVLAVAASGVFSSFAASVRPRTNFIFFRYRQYVLEHPDVGMFNALQLAFARGILHPKTH